jgi:hypothetical protein
MWSLDNQNENIITLNLNHYEKNDKMNKFYYNIAGQSSSIMNDGDRTQNNKDNNKITPTLFQCPIDFNKNKYGYFTFDVQEKKDTEDPNLQRIYEFDQLSPTQKLDFHRDWTKIIYPEDLSIVRQAHLDAYKTGKYNAKFRVKLPVSNKIVWIQACGNVIFDQDGNPRLISGLNALLSS